jgi:hypothetical protein
MLMPWRWNGAKQRWRKPDAPHISIVVSVSRIPPAAGGVAESPNI